MSCILKACKLNQCYRGRILYDKRNQKLSPGKSTSWICSALLSDIFPDWGGGNGDPPPFRSEGDLPPQLRTPIPITVTCQSRRFLPVVKSINMSLSSYHIRISIASQCSQYCCSQCVKCVQGIQRSYFCVVAVNHINVCFECVLSVFSVSFHNLSDRSLSRLPWVFAFFWFIVSGSIYDCWGGNAYVRDLNMGGRICSSFSLALARFLTLSLSLSPAVFLSLSLTPTHIHRREYVCVLNSKVEWTHRTLSESCMSV